MKDSKNTATMTREEVAAEIVEVAEPLRDAFRAAGPDLDFGKSDLPGDDGTAKSVAAVNMQKRLNDLGERADEFAAADATQTRLDAIADGKGFLVGDALGASLDATGEEIKSFYKQFMDSDAYKNRKAGSPESVIDVDVKAYLEQHEAKTVMSTGAGFAPQDIRSGLVVGAAFQTPLVVDLIPVVPTDQAAYVYMSQTTRTNNAAEIKESVDGTLQTSAESAFAWTQVTETIRKISHHVPVTDEQLEDIPGMLALINGDMVSGVRERLSSQIINGDGTAPNIEGFLDAGRATIDVDTTGDFYADAADKLIENVRKTGFAEPDAFVTHPTDWHRYRRATTTDGIYIAGHPSDDVAARLWAKPAVVTTEIAAGSMLCGAFNQYSKLVVKRGVSVQISSEHASNFLTGVQTIKAEMRATLAVTRETAFADTNDIA